MSQTSPLLLTLSFVVVNLPSFWQVSENALLRFKSVEITIFYAPPPTPVGLGQWGSVVVRESD